MPELPDLVYIEKELRPLVVNSEISAVAVWEPIVLRMGRERFLKVEEADRGIGAKVRDHLRVRNRPGYPCPACGTTIRRTGVLGYDSFFCPKRQPEPGSCLVPWEKLS